MGAYRQITLVSVSDPSCGKQDTPTGEHRGGLQMDTRNEIKSYIVLEGWTMADLVEKLAEQYSWSASVPNLSGKLRRDSLRYREAVELADALGYDIIWQRRREVR